MTKPIWLLAIVGCAASASCSAPVPAEDAGQPPPDSGSAIDGGGTGDSGSPDGGPGDAGQGDGGSRDGGPGDGGGCTGTAAAQLAFVSAPQTLDARACSAPLKVQLQTACGAPVTTGQDLPLVLSTSAATTELFGDPACLGKPAVFVLPAGADSLELYFNDPAPGQSTISVSGAGLDGGSQLQTIVCAAGEKDCNATSCIPIGSCCTDPDCTAPKLCLTGQCRVPACPAFVHSCTVFTDLTAPAANRTVTFSSAGFSPKCIRIAPSQTVGFSGDFFLHPLEQSCGPAEVTLAAFGNPRTASGFGTFGTYGFRCKTHPLSENGAVKVP